MLEAYGLHTIFTALRSSLRHATAYLSMYGEKTTTFDAFATIPYLGCFLGSRTSAICRGCQPRSALFKPRLTTNNASACRAAFCRLVPMEIAPAPVSSGRRFHHTALLMEASKSAIARSNCSFANARYSRRPRQVADWPKLSYNLIPRRSLPDRRLPGPVA